MDADYCQRPGWAVARNIEDRYKDLLMLSPNRLRAFREVATRGSLAGAARVLCLTQSAVSQQVAALEEEAGLALFERTRRGVRLTDAGRLLVQRADTILHQLKEAERELQSMAAGDTGRVRVGAFPTAAATVVSRAIATLHSSAPGIDVVLTEAEPRDVLALLEEGELDLALDFDFDLLPDPGSSQLVRVPVFEEPFYVALRAGHERARQARLALGDFAEETWIGGRACACMGLLEVVCQRAGFRPRLQFGTSDYATIQGLVAAGGGVAFLPSLALANLRQGLVARRLTDVRARRRIRLVRRAGSQYLSALRRVGDAILASAVGFRARGESRPGQHLSRSRR
jgi:DNA-binding transcriptional LysR family regulator